MSKALHIENSLDRIRPEIIPGMPLQSFIRFSLQANSVFVYYFWCVSVCALVTHARYTFFFSLIVYNRLGIFFFAGSTQGVEAQWLDTRCITPPFIKST